MVAPLVDDSRAPLVTVTYPQGMDVADVRFLFERYATLSRKHPRIGYLIDLRAANPLLFPADIRRTMNALFDEHRELLLRVTVCEARVAPNVVVRGAIDLFDWAAPKKWPCASFATMPEAEAWVSARLSGAAPSSRPPGR
jgi:hypothetical protein